MGAVPLDRAPPPTFQLINNTSPSPTGASCGASKSPSAGRVNSRTQIKNSTTAATTIPAVEPVPALCQKIATATTNGNAVKTPPKGVDETAHPKTATTASAAPINTINTKTSGGRLPPNPNFRFKTRPNPSQPATTHHAKIANAIAAIHQLPRSSRALVENTARRVAMNSPATKPTTARTRQSTGGASGVE